MAATVIFDVINALIAKFATVLPAVTVYDSFPDTDAPPDSYIVVGIPDPSDANAATSASSVQEWAHTNHTRRDEAGDVWCVAVAADGGNSPAAARATVRAMTDAVEAALRDDYTLGVTGLLWTSYGTSTDLQQDRTDRGAIAMLVFSVHFRARI